MTCSEASLTVGGCNDTHYEANEPSQGITSCMRPWAERGAPCRRHPTRAGCGAQARREGGHSMSSTFTVEPLSNQSVHLYAYGCRSPSISAWHAHPVIPTVTLRHPFSHAACCWLYDSPGKQLYVQCRADPAMNTPTQESRLSVPAHHAPGTLKDPLPYRIHAHLQELKVTVLPVPSLCSLSAFPLRSHQPSQPAVRSFPPQAGHPCTPNLGPPPPPSCLHTTSPVNFQMERDIQGPGGSLSCHTHQVLLVVMAQQDLKHMGTRV